LLLTSYHRSQFMSI